MIFPANITTDKKAIKRIAENALELCNFHEDNNLRCKVHAPDFRDVIDYVFPDENSRIELRDVLVRFHDETVLNNLSNPESQKLFETFKRETAKLINISPNSYRYYEENASNMEQKSTNQFLAEFVQRPQPRRDNSELHDTARAIVNNSGIHKKSQDVKPEPKKSLSIKEKITRVFRRGKTGERIR